MAIINAISASNRGHGNHQSRLAKVMVPSERYFHKNTHVQYECFISSSLKVMVLFFFPEVHVGQTSKSSYKVKNYGTS